MSPHPDPSLAHELRTPLHAVLAAVALLGETALTAEQREHVATIREAARALVDVADAALADAAELPNATTACDPRRLVDGVRRLLAPLAAAKGLAFDVTVAADVPAELRAPAGPLRQVLVNLVGNAVKFTAAGGVALHVRRAARAAGREAGDEADVVPVVIEVHDTGPGLDAAQQAQLFQPFARPAASDAAGTDAAGTDVGGTNAGGTGLGLAIAAALVRRMGGEIGVRGAAGAGCTFWVRLSAWDERADAARPTPAPHAIVPHAIVPHADAGARTVLVVDDDAVGRRVTAQLLARLGWRVDLAATIAEADAALRARPYDAVLLDRHLGDGDGCDLAAAHRARERASGAPATRIVALTAAADPATRRRSLAAGMDACLVKPVGADALRAAIAPPGESPVAAPIVDAARLDTLERLDADAPGLLARIAEDYARGAESQLARLRAALGAGDLAAAAHAAHAVRGSSASAGAPRAAAIAADVERAALEGRVATDGSLDALAAAVRAAATALADRRRDATVAR